MDPNETLRLLRQAIDRAERLDGKWTQEEFASEMASVPDWFSALDTWLTQGGFTPDDWQDPRAAALVSWWDSLTPEERGMTGVELDPHD